MRLMLTRVAAGNLVAEVRPSLLWDASTLTNQHNPLEADSRRRPPRDEKP